MCVYTVMIGNPVQSLNVYKFSAVSVQPVLLNYSAVYPTSHFVVNRMIVDYFTILVPTYGVIPSFNSSQK